MNRFASKISMLFILCSILLIILNIGTVKASETIYIRADGTVEGTGKIQREGSVYIFTSNISIDVADAEGITVERDNIVIDGAGYTLQGTGNGTGIYLSERSNVTIKNMQIRDFTYGILIYGSSNNNISGNLLADNGSGLNFFGGHYNNIIGNTIMSNGRGIHVVLSVNNSLYGNSIIDNALQYYDDWYHQPFNPKALSVNIWDNGTTGNYWSDYNGTDNDGDGIGDTPYIIGEDNQDNHPLMNKFIIPEFPSWFVLPLFLFASVVAVIVRRRVAYPKSR